MSSKVTIVFSVDGVDTDKKVIKDVDCTTNKDVKVKIQQHARLQNIVVAGFEFFDPEFGAWDGAVDDTIAPKVQGNRVVAVKVTTADKTAPHKPLLGPNSSSSNNSASQVNFATPKRKYFDVGHAVGILHNRLMLVDLTKLDDPRTLSWLPFPVAGDYAIPERFIARSDHSVPVIGRKCFDKLEKSVLKFLACSDTTPTATAATTAPPATIDDDDVHQILRRFLIYGNMGAGKSHLILMLALRLRKNFLSETPVKRRVVIVPSALSLINNGFEYLLTAVKLACADDKQDLQELEGCKNADELGGFCNAEGTRFVFIVDQADVLEQVSDQAADRSIAAAAANEARGILSAVIGPRNFVIYGSSANNETAKQRFKKQQDIDFFDIFGGFDYEEMEQWLRFYKRTLTLAQKDQLFADTKGVPLFLYWFKRNSSASTDYSKDNTKFLEDYGLFLKCPQLVDAIANIDSWVGASLNTPGFEDLANAFITESPLPTGAAFQSYDNKYFYVENNKSFCVAGFIQKQLTQSLRRRKGHALFLAAQWFDKVKEEAESTKCNKSVLGFLAEQAVISTLATGSLVFCGKARNFGGDVKWFETGNEKAMIGAKERDALFLPTVFNYPNVDMVFSLDDSKPFRVGVQVTLQDYSAHKQAATKFMNTGVCKYWLGVDKGFDDYQWHFVWVMPARKIAAIKKAVPSKYAGEEHKTRGRKGQAQRAAFTEHFYSFEQLNPALALLDTK